MSNPTPVSGTPNSCNIFRMISRKTVKSKASSVQPSHAAHQAYHWSLVGSFHHGMFLTVSTAAILYLPFERTPLRSLADCVGTHPSWAGSGDCQVGHEYLSLRLRAQKNGDEENRQTHDRGDEDRTRERDLVGGRVPNQQR